MASHQSCSHHFYGFTALTAGLLMTGLAAGEPAASNPTGIVNCEMEVPTGEYAVVFLDFDVPGAVDELGRKWTYHGALRAGRMRMDDLVGMREPGGWLNVKNSRLTGSFNRHAWGNSPYMARTLCVVTVDAEIKGGVITGTAKIGDKIGSISGRLIPETELAKTNAVAKDRTWPSFLGDAGCAAQPTGVATVETVDQMRLIWRSEEPTPGACGTVTRMMNNFGDAAGMRTAGGSWSPVAGDGRIFVSYFLPTPPKVNEDWIKGYQEAAKTAGTPLGIESQNLPERLREKAYIAADEVVAAMDAATGKTLWKSVVKGRAANFQHHKGGPFNMSPAYGVGKVFVLGKSGNLYAFDAATGAPVWETKSEADYSNALLVSGDVVVAPAAGTWGGYDVKTGQLRWKAGMGRGMATLSRWTHGGKDYLVGRMGPENAPTGVSCLESATGKEVWNQPIAVLTGGRGLGPGGITIHGDCMLVYETKGKGGKTDPVLPALAAYRLDPAKADPLWTVGAGSGGTPVEVKEGEPSPIHGESVPVVVNGRFVFTPDLRVLDLATGKETGRATGPMPRNGGYMESIEDLVFVRIDGTHGAIACGFYKVSPTGSVTCLNEKTPWAPLPWRAYGGGTSSYHHPMMFPMVDGRMFMRLYDGIYCWDLRKVAAQ